MRAGLTFGVPTNTIEQTIIPIPDQNKFILTIAEGIAHHEGFYAQGTNPSKRNNNPGNLRGWDSNLPTDKQGFTEFPDRKSGFRALYKQVEKNIIQRELSLREFFAGKPGVYGGFAPDSDGNNSLQYAQFVETFLEDRGFYPLSVDHVLVHWFNEIGGQGAKDEPFNVSGVERIETNAVEVNLGGVVYKITPKV